MKFRTAPQREHGALIISNSASSLRLNQKKIRLITLDKEEKH